MNQKEMEALKGRIRQLVGKSPFFSMHPRVVRAVLRGEGGSVLTQLLAMLNDLYWEGAAGVVEEACRRRSEVPRFTPAERLWIDMGYLGEEFMGEESKRVLRQDLNLPRKGRCYYLSEWLVDQGLRSVFLGSVERQESQDRPDDKVSRLRAERRQLYLRVKGLFGNLPGVPDSVVELVVVGKLDRHLEELLGLKEGGDEEKELQEREKLLAVRRKIFERARARCDRKTQVDVLNRIDQIGEEVRQALEAAGPRQEGGRPAGADGRSGELEAYLKKELRLMQTLMALGLPGSKMRRLCSICLDVESRADRWAVQEFLEQVIAFDPRIPGDPDLVIAPFYGTGFFEWDHDLLFVPLHPMVDFKESILAALATYRLMGDALQEGGRMAKEYQRWTGGSSVGEVFRADYAAWILRVGKGEREAMDAPRRAFFRHWVGPSEKHLLAPRRFQNLSKLELDRLRLELQDTVRGPEATADDLYHLAILYSLCEMSYNAQPVLERAVQMNPAHPQILCAMGFLYRRMGNVARSRQMFEAALLHGRGTIWSVYAQDELGM
jgi:hypothetical protein